MLEPQSRTLLLNALRPPEGHHLDFGVGTTFSLDLMTLLTTPLAFTWFDLGAEEVEPNALEVVESLRRYADRFVIFCHAGRILLPRSAPPQLEFLENSVFECLAPRGGAFHPKIWVLRYTGDSQSVIYRFLCLSRNLTFSRSWDTVLSMDGLLQKSVIRRNEPLATFLRILPRCAIRTLPERIAERLGQISEELRRVDFKPPEGVAEFRFWPVGTTSKTVWPFQDLGRQTLVISPFLDLGLLERLANGESGNMLVSTQEAFSSLERRPEGYEIFRVLDERAQAEFVDDEAAAEGGSNDGNQSGAAIIELTGLHAKCYVTEKGKTAHIWTGSANATEAAFGRNVEFLVQLSGPKKVLGIDTLMKESDDGRDVRFCRILKDAGRVVATNSQEALDELGDICLERCRTALAKARLTAKISGHETEDRYDVELCASHQDFVLPEGIRATCWPVTISEQNCQNVITGGSTIARFTSVTFEALTSFFAFRLYVENSPSGLAFVLQVPLEGAPADRHNRVLRSIVKDRNRLLRFLMLLLSDEQSLTVLDNRESPPGRGNSAEPHKHSVLARGLLESLVRTLDRAPERLDEVARLLSDLGEDQNALCPEEFDSIWAAIWAARQEGKGCQAK